MRISSASRLCAANKLLIGGTRSPRYLTDGLYRLADLLPRAEKILVEESHHFSPSASPHLVVPALKAFFPAG
ncbi:hypothetical protein SK803_29815 [Lentzea sp. BCCO 10_0856]|uniref:Uncharacterized protein n=1 Tax=Lentzea miocenica TaxID=3095431 RepID=A0ABU4T8K3_9PSEU|nr:hypothetical protein [Lentzea sp. BCCO 10_0856]MDX8034435.1 hypothetical protein [Lentzea sp. BCCO 10_0856]